MGELSLTSELPGDNPGRFSGDFAIDNAGQYAYGIVTAGGEDALVYRIDLSSGAVTAGAPYSGNGAGHDYGSAAFLPDGSIAHFNSSEQKIFVATANSDYEVLESSFVVGVSGSSDGARCLPEPTPPAPASIPTLGTWSMLLLGGLLAGLAAMRRRFGWASLG